MIKIGRDKRNGYYLDRDTHPQIIKELNDNGYVVKNRWYNSYPDNDTNNISNGNNSLTIPINKGNLFLELFLTTDKSYIKTKQKIVFDIENGEVVFDIAKVNKYYEAWAEKDKKRQIRENISAFKGPLVLSYIRGKLDEYGIVYKEPQEKYFVTSEFNIHYVEPTPSELAKLNMERVKVFLRFKMEGNKYEAEVYLIPFLKSPKEQMEKIKVLIDTRDNEENTLDAIVSKYEKQIDEMTAELERVNNIGRKLTEDKYKLGIKQLFSKESK